MNPSTALASVLIDELARCGVRDAVLAPGSRSAPLAYALFEANQADRIRLHVRVDERGAGFLALGLAKVSRRPVPVVCTSGTAAANLHPAVLEAHHAGVPLLLLTADRPPELRGIGANQTTDQIKLYGDAVRLFHEVGVPEERPDQNAYWRSLACRAVGAARGVRDRDPGPVHLNLAFREPLVPDRPNSSGADGLSDTAERPQAGRGWPESLDGRPHGARWTRIDRLGEERIQWLESGPRTVVLAGDGADPKARWLAETAGWPLLAEPSSGARSGPNAIGPYRLLLGLDDRPLVRSIERVVVYGRPTLSRPVSRLLARDDVEIVVVAAAGSWPDAGRRARRVGPVAALEGTADGAGRAEPDSWLGDWLNADREAGAAVEKVLSAEPAPTGPAVAREVAAAVPEGGLLVAGSSNPVRDLDLAGQPWQNGLLDDAGRVDVRQQRRVVANRGLSGIDGTVSTAIGAALAHRRGPAYGLVGDVTFLHDLNAWVRGPEEPTPDGPDLTMVVVNDNGGGVFSTLEQGGSGYAESFERLFGTPHQVDLEAFATAVRTPYVRASSLPALREALARSRGPRIVEVPIDRARTRHLHVHLREAVAGAI